MVCILIVLCHHLRLLNRLGVLQRPILTSQPPRHRTVHDAVGRVIQTLLEVLEVRVLKELFDSLANTELNGLLTNHVDVERAYLEHLCNRRKGSRVLGRPFCHCRDGACKIPIT